MGLFVLKAAVVPSHSTAAPAHMSTYQPPRENYHRPGPSTTLAPPSNSYLPPPSTTAKPSYKEIESVHRGTPLSVPAKYSTPHPSMSTSYAPPTRGGFTKKIFSETELKLIYFLYLFFL